MDQYNWKIQVDQIPGRLAKRIWVFRPKHTGEVEVLQSDFEKITTYPGQYHSKENIEPTVVIEEDLLRLLVDACINIKPAERQYTEGKLEATESHLEDLRHLLKLPKPGVIISGKLKNNLGD
jgi:hypothetical protein